MRKNLQQLDLNLLKVLMALLETHNTRKAAELLFISQPAVSRALGRLRDFFNDELFVRGNYGLTPTPKALELEQQLKPAIGMIYNALEPDDEFDPSELTSKIHIAINGFIANSIASKLCSAILEEAPLAEVIISNWDNNTAQAILNDQVQIGINYFPLDLSKQLHQTKITEDRFVLLARKGHPLVSGEQSLQEYPVLDIASLIVPNWNEQKALVINALKSFDKECRIKLRSTYIDVILDSVRATDMLFPCSESLAVKLDDDFSVVPVPEHTVLPSGEFGSITAYKNRQQPRLKWLQGCVTKVLKP